MSFEFFATTLGDFLTFSNGKSSPVRCDNGKIVVFGANGEIGRCNETNSQSNSIIVGRVGSYCGAVHFSKSPCWITDNAIKAVVKNGNDPFFAYCLLKQLNLNNWRSGSGQPLINQSTLNSILVTIPPPREQKAIGYLASTIDYRISLLRETNTTLEAIAQTLFKSWFVDFDPVKAKAEGRLPEGMDEATAALFPSEFEESALGLIPKGWRVSSVNESFILTMGQSPSGSTYNESGDGLPFYQGRTDFGFRFPTQRIFCNAPTRFAEIGDTLVSVRAPVGDVNMALERCCIGRGVASVRHPFGYSGFTFYSIKNLRSHFELFESEGTVFGSINKKDFQELPIIEPINNVLKAFDEVVSVMDDRITINEEKLRTLTTIRDTLLPRLISGQLRLNQAQDLLDELTA